ncbi:hypothetical protein BH09MYX1_BH09MYX1_10940 [soil metagenome]
MTTLRKTLSVSAFALTLATASVASAQTCPPGSWFCADAQIQGSATVTVGGGGALQPLPPPVVAPPVVIQQAPPVVYAPPVAVAPPPPPVVIYQPAPQQTIYVPRPVGYVPTYRRQALPYRLSEWGINLRLDAAAFGGARNGGGMGGLGAALRYKPLPWLGVEGGVDFIFGRDYNGLARNETAFSVAGLIFVNPQSRAQFYFLGGVGWSLANVSNDYYDSSSNWSDKKYAYFGGMAGVGLEYRASRTIAFNVDVRGFIRGRTDGDAKNDPEFRDTSTGKTTNTSGGALVTAGMTFYF